VGLASGFYSVDDYGSVIDSAAFDDTLEQFLENGFITYEHDMARPIGKPTAVRSTDEGIVVDGEIYPEMFDGASVLAGMRRGVIREMSIGFFVDDEAPMDAKALGGYWQERGYQPTENDIKAAAKGVRLIKKITLIEAAICMRGANPVARVQGVRSMLRKFLGLAAPDDKPVEEQEPEAMPEPPKNQAANEKEVADIVARFLPALQEALTAVVTQMASERMGDMPEDEPAPADDDEAPKDTASYGDKPTDEDEEAEKMALSALLVAGQLLADISAEAALEEGR
jgi:HK97 family phage prohead protease